MSSQDPKTPTRNGLPTSLSLEEFGRLMSLLDLAGVPPENRAAAIIDHATRIMADHLIDRSRASELYSAYLMRQKIREQH